MTPERGTAKACSHPGAGCGPEAQRARHEAAAAALRRDALRRDLELGGGVLLLLAATAMLILAWRRLARRRSP
jgi:hypothetical protein